MPFLEERQKRLECGYDELPIIEYLDEHVEDEVVSDLEYFSSQSNNEIKIKRPIKRLKILQVRYNTFIECFYYIQNFKK